MRPAFREGELFAAACQHWWSHLPITDDGGLDKSTFATLLQAFPSLQIPEAVRNPASLRSTVLHEPATSRYIPGLSEGVHSPSLGAWRGGSAAVQLTRRRRLQDIEAAWQLDVGESLGASLHRATFDAMLFELAAHMVWVTTPQAYAVFLFDLFDSVFPDAPVVEKLPVALLSPNVTKSKPPKRCGVASSSVHTSPPALSRRPEREAVY
jgi:hypothetical protein